MAVVAEVLPSALAGALTEEQRQLKSKLDEIEARWLESMEQLEAS